MCNKVERNHRYIFVATHYCQLEGTQALAAKTPVEIAHMVNKALNDISRLEAKKKKEDTKHLDRAISDYEDEIKKIIVNHKEYIPRLKEENRRIDQEWHKLEDTRLTLQGRREIEEELNNEFGKEIRAIELDQRKLKDRLDQLTTIIEKFQDKDRTYLPSEWPIDRETCERAGHPNRYPKGEGVSWFCPDCGKKGRD